MSIIIPQNLNTENSQTKPNEFKTFDFEAWEKAGGNKKEAIEHFKTKDLDFDIEEVEEKLRIITQKMEQILSFTMFLKLQKILNIKIKKTLPL